MTRRTGRPSDVRVGWRQSTEGGGGGSGEVRQPRERVGSVAESERGGTRKGSMKRFAIRRSDPCGRPGRRVACSRSDSSLKWAVANHWQPSLRPAPPAIVAWPNGYGTVKGLAHVRRWKVTLPVLICVTCKCGSCARV